MPDTHIDAELKKLAEEFKAFRQKILQAFQSNDIDQAVKSLAKADPSVSRWALLLDLQKGNVTPLSATQYELYELYEGIVRNYIDQIKVIKQKNSSLTRLESILKDPLTHIAIGGEYDFVKSLYSAIEPIAHKDYFSPHATSARKQILTFISNYRSPVASEIVSPKSQVTLPEEELKILANQFEEQRSQVIEIIKNNDIDRAINKIEKLYLELGKTQKNTLVQSHDSTSWKLTTLQATQYLLHELQTTLLYDYMIQTKILKKHNPSLTKINTDDIQLLIPNEARLNENEFVRSLYNHLKTKFGENFFTGTYCAAIKETSWPLQSRYYGHILIEKEYHINQLQKVTRGFSSYTLLNLELIESLFENGCRIDQKIIENVKQNLENTDCILEQRHRIFQIILDAKALPVRWSNNNWELLFSLASQNDKGLILTFWQAQMLRMQTLWAYNDYFNRMMKAWSSSPKETNQKLVEAQRFGKIFELPKTSFVRLFYEMTCEDEFKILPEFDSIFSIIMKINDKKYNGFPLFELEEVCPVSKRIRNQFIDSAQNLPETITDKTWVDHSGYKVYLPSGLGFLNPYHLGFFVRQTGELGSIVKTQTRHLKNQAVTQIITKGSYLPYAYQSADNWSRYLVVIGQASAWSGEALIQQNEAVNHFVDYCQQGNTNPLTSVVCETVRKVDDGITIIGVPLTQTVAYTTTIPTQIDHAAYKSHFHFVHSGGAADFLGEDAGSFIQATACLNWSDMGYYWIKLQGHDKAADLLYKKNPRDTQSAARQEDCLEQMIEIGILTPPTQKPQSKQSTPQFLFLDGFVEMNKDSYSNLGHTNDNKTLAIVR